MTIKQVQHLLGYLGYYNGAVDGIWGRQSKAAASSFQEDYGDLAVDGLPGEQTCKALMQAVHSGMPTRREEDFWAKVRYWSRDEFRCRCGGKYCNGFPVEPDKTLVELVDDIRSKAGRVAHASSGIRCAVWNSLQGGVSNSRHLMGKALDFSVEATSGQQLLTLVQTDPRTRYAYIIDDGWVHVDVA